MSFWPLETSLVELLKSCAHVVELGSGDGGFARYLARHEIDPILVDHNENTLRAAGSRWRRVAGNAKAIPFADASVDAICCANLFRSLQADLGTVTKELQRVLRPGGCLVLFEDDVAAENAAEQCYRETLELLAALDRSRGVAVGPQEITPVLSGRLGAPVLEGRIRNELRVENPGEPLEWIATRSLDGLQRQKLAELTAKVRRNGMEYGHYWFRFYRKSLAPA